jgi:flagellar hook-basal body complex protein FliE
MNSITTNLPVAPDPLKLQRGGPPQADSSFEKLLVDSLQQVNGMQTEADQAVEAMFTGEDVNPAEVLTAVQKADLAFQLTMQLRNKAMDVYREIRDIRI